VEPNSQSLNQSQNRSPNLNRNQSQNRSPSLNQSQNQNQNRSQKDQRQLADHAHQLLADHAQQLLVGQDQLQLVDLNRSQSPNQNRNQSQSQSQSQSQNRKDQPQLADRAHQQLVVQDQPRQQKHLAVTSVATAATREDTPIQKTVPLFTSAYPDIHHSWSNAPQRDSSMIQRNNSASGQSWLHLHVEPCSPSLSQNRNQSLSLSLSQNLSQNRNQNQSRNQSLSLSQNLSQNQKDQRQPADQGQPPLADPNQSQSLSLNPNPSQNGQQLLADHDRRQPAVLAQQPRHRRQEMVVTSTALAWKTECIQTPKTAILSTTAWKDIQRPTCLTAQTALSSIQTSLTATG